MNCLMYNGDKSLIFFMCQLLLSGSLPILLLAINRINNPHSWRQGMCAHFTCWQTRAEDRVAHPPTHSPMRVCPSLHASPVKCIYSLEKADESRHSSTESLGCPHTSGDKHIPPKGCILLNCMDHFPPASICRKEKAAAFLERRMCCLFCFSQPSCCVSNIRCLEPDFFEEAYEVLGTTLPR